MPGIELSVLIPTFNRADILAKCLEAFLGQTAPKETYEIIVVNDGSTDDTEILLKSLTLTTSPALRFFNQSRKGISAARNLGIRNAQGKIILSFDDDIIPQPDLLDQHLLFHNQFKEGVISIGFIGWHPEVKVTSLMRYTSHANPHNTARHLQELPFYSFGAGHASARKGDFLDAGLFDEDLQPLEDTEMGYRLSQRGIRFLFNRRAKGYHYRTISLRGFCKRQEATGESIAKLHRKHPAIKLFRENLSLGDSYKLIAQRNIPTNEKYRIIFKKIFLHRFFYIISLIVVKIFNLLRCRPLEFFLYRIISNYNVLLGLKRKMEEAGRLP